MTKMLQIMAIIYPCIVPAKVLKDGRHKIRIAVSHHSETKFITTDIILDNPSFLNNGVVTKCPNATYLNTRLRSIIKKYQTLLDAFPYPESCTCSELTSMLKEGRQFNERTIRSVFEEYTQLGHISPGTVRTYGIAFSTISRFIDPETPIASITPLKVRSLDGEFRKMKLSTSTIRNYMIGFRVLINYAINSGYVEYKTHPFASYTVPRGNVRDAWLSVDEIKAIRDCKPILASVAVCRDLFLLSYYLGGINLVDLLKLNFKNLDVIKYTRQKVSARTNAFVEFDIPMEAKTIIEKYRGSGGKLISRFGKHKISHSFIFSFINPLAFTYPLHR